MIYPFLWISNFTPPFIMDYLSMVGLKLIHVRNRGPSSHHGCHRGCLNNPIFSNLGLCAVCWAHFMCHHELWPTSVSHPFSFLNSSLGFAGEKHYQKIIIPIFRLVLQNFAIPGYFPYILFYCYLFSLLSSDWFVIVVCGSISVRELVKS